MSMALDLILFLLYDIVVTFGMALVVSVVVGIAVVLPLYILFSFMNRMERSCE